MKDTKEIVENILRMKSSDYEFVDQSEIVTSRKTILLQKSVEREANVLPRHTDRDLEHVSEDEESEHDDCMNIEHLESYQPSQEMEFEVSEVKDCFEKKKKRRNYIEFRPDYSKIV